ncbi:MAG TPA: hypothetical protein VNS63_01505 [Blastocatellia bacterium]|nr:hypothetical protein [Blastocatellia bacterium]
MKELKDEQPIRWELLFEAANGPEGWPGERCPICGEALLGDTNGFPFGVHWFEQLVLEFWADTPQGPIDPSDWMLCVPCSESLIELRSFLASGVELFKTVHAKRDREFPFPVVTSAGERREGSAN